MSETWFHATTGGGRNGPMHADDLLRLFQAGRIDATTPVWREGMPDWVPLASVATSLGLPPMPPSLPHASQPAPRRGMHWIWIVVTVLAVVLVPTVAILAAIALPAYNDYRLRAGVSEVSISTTLTRLAMYEAVEDGHDCDVPLDAETGSQTAATLHTALSDLRVHRHVAGVQVNTDAAPGQCRFDVTLQGFDHDQIDGRQLVWALDPPSGTWTCSGSVAPRFLPPSCRT